VEARDQAPRGLVPGEIVRVNGELASEGSPASLALARLERLGTGVLPTSRAVALDPLSEGLAGIVDFAGAADGERVEIAGIVRSAATQNDWVNGTNLVLKVVTTSGEFDVRCSDPAAGSGTGWIDASVRVRGVVDSTM